MAKKRRRSKRRFNLRRVRVSNSTAVGALTSQDVLTGGLTNAADDTYRCVSVKFVYGWTGIAAIDDGMEFGLAHSDYSAAEIEECLEANNSIDLGDKVAQEQANRLVRTIGIFQGTPNTAAGGSVHNDGRPVHTKLNWLMSIADTLSIWVRNSTGTVYTTGSNITTIGDMWVKP